MRGWNPAKRTAYDGHNESRSQAERREPQKASQELPGADRAAAYRFLPAYVYFAAGRGPREPAQATTKGLLPDFRRGSRGSGRSGRLRPQGRIRLVLSLLPRSRALSGAGRYSLRNAARRRGCGGRPQFRRTADAFALGFQAFKRGDAIVLHRDPDSTSRRLRGSGALFRGASQVDAEGRWRLPPV